MAVALAEFFLRLLRYGKGLRNNHVFLWIFMKTYAVMPINKLRILDLTV